MFKINLGMIRYQRILILIPILHLSLCDISSKHANSDKPQPTPYHDWDYLMFSQRWPITSCAQWEESSSKNTCNMPNDKYVWTVHGIWPTKIGTDGPAFCPSAVHFDPQQLKPIMNDLQQYWTNVEGGTKPNSFWKHEWDKHGTCAVVQPELNSVYNFFEQGLEWNKQYRIGDILAQGNIKPQDNGYRVDQISDAIRNVLKKNITVQCVVDAKTKESLISEIRICFDKSFQLIDCDPTNPNHLTDDVITNCSLKKPVMYLGTVPTRDDDDEEESLSEESEIELQMYYRERNTLMNVYRFIKFLLWFTL